MEAKEANSATKAATLISEFEKHFKSIYCTIHPSGTPGEIAGKSANVAFGASQAIQRHLAAGDGDDVIITVIDGKYFFCILTQFCRC
jgi:hypothetical protein